MERQASAKYFTSTYSLGKKLYANLLNKQSMKYQKFSNKNQQSEKYT
jgi:hypothetical protein